MRATLLLVTTAVAFGCADAPTSPTRMDLAPAAFSTLGGERITTQSRIDTAFGHGGAEVSATLTGAAEVPGPGDADGSGSVRITLNPGQGEVCFDLEVSGIAAATGAHIHVGGPTVAGDVVVPLTPPTGGSSTACVSADEDLVKAILKNPSGYYVNVHNADFPLGAIRGQLAH